jgi:hypothetical protein
MKSIIVMYIESVMNGENSWNISLEEESTVNVDMFQEHTWKLEISK